MLVWSSVTDTLVSATSGAEREGIADQWVRARVGYRKPWTVP
jgi:hypothetical protein